MSNHPNHTTTLVLGGASGKTGRRVAARLRARDVPVRIGSRSGAPPFDWDDRETWAPVLDGVGAAYVAYVPDLAVPGAADAIRAFSALAVDSGVRRLVLLSGRGEEEAQASERIVAASGAEWTVVRSAWFAQNFSEAFIADQVGAGTVALPVGDVPEPFVDLEDVADVAVAALTEDGHAGEIYELTGPRPLTFAQATAEVGRAIGRPLDYAQVPLDAFLAEASQQGLPADAVALLRYLFGELFDGRNAATADGVQRALGRAPRDFGDYARATAASGAWAG